jgi:uncharacterized protein (TIGR02594 family)
MVDILRESGALGVRQGTIDGPRSSLTAEEIARPYSRLADAVGGLGDMLNQVARPGLETAARESVTRDAEGNVQVGRRLEFTDNDKAYNAAALQAGLAMGKTAISEQMQALRLEYDGRPEEFKRAASELSRTVGKGSTRELQPFLRLEADRQAGQHYEGLMGAKHDLDLRRSLDALNAREGSVADQLRSLASQGGTATDEFQRLRSELDDIRGQKAANPKLNYTPERKAAEDAALDNGLKADAIVGIARREYERTGDLAGVQSRTERDLQAIGLSPEETSKHLRQVSSNLAGAAAARSERLNDATERAQAMRLQIEQGGVGAVDPRQLEATRSELNAGRRWSAVRQLDISVGAATGAAAINGARSTSDMIGALNAPPMPGRRAASAADVAANYVGLTEGADAGAIMDFMRKAGGAVIDPRKVPWCAAAVDAFLGLAGKERRNSLRAADFLSYGTATDAPTRGDVVVFKPQAAGASGHVGIVVGVEGGRVRYIAGNDSNAVQETTLPMSEVAGFRVPPTAGTPIAGVTTGAGSEAFRGRADVVGYGATDLAGMAEMRSRQETFDKRSASIFEEMEKTWKGGNQPSSTEVQELMQLAPFIKDPALRKKVGERVALEATRMAAAGTPIPDLERFQSQLLDADRSGGLAPLQREELRAVEKSLAAQRQAIDKNPYKAATSFDFGADLNGINKAASQPIEWGNRESAAASIAARSRSSALLENLQRVTPRSLIPEAEHESFAAAMSSANGDGVRMIYDGLMSGRKENLAATMDDAKVRDVLMTATRSRDPAKMQAAFSGLDALYRANSPEFIAKFGESAVERLMNWQALRDYMTPEETVKAINNPTDGLVGPELKRLESEARKHFRDNVTTDDARKIFDGWVSSAAFPDDGKVLPPGVPRVRDAVISDFERIYIERYKASRDEKTAMNQAQELIKSRWGVSSVGGTAIMRYPPERHYPAVNGSHDWMKTQLESEVRTLLGAGATRPVELGASEGMMDAPVQSLNIQLLSSRATAADISSGRPPGYLVTATVNGETRLLSGPDGAPLVYRFNPNAPQTVARKEFEQSRAARQAGDLGSMSGFMGGQPSDAGGVR